MNQNPNDDEESKHYVVVFHKIKSLNHGLSQEECEKICSTFRFSKKGEEYFFDKSSNPQYSNHIVKGLLTLRHDQFLEVDTVNTKFTVNGKSYQTVSWLSNITYLDPFQVKGILNNEYYQAAYVVLSDDFDATEKSMS